MASWRDLSGEDKKMGENLKHQMYRRISEADLESSKERNVICMWYNMWVMQSCSASGQDENDDVIVVFKVCIQESRRSHRLMDICGEIWGSYRNPASHCYCKAFIHSHWMRERTHKLRVPPTSKICSVVCLQQGISSNLWLEMPYVRLSDLRAFIKLCHRWQHLSNSTHSLAVKAVALKSLWSQDLCIAFQNIESMRPYWGPTLGLIGTFVCEP